MIQFFFLLSSFEFHLVGIEIQFKSIKAKEERKIVDD